MNPAPSLMMDLFKSMLRIRRVEEEVARRYKEWEIRCPTHLCIGQEAVASGVCAALGRADAVFSNHRAHGHYLAKGGDLTAFVAELYGRSAGCAGGIGGSMHLVDVRAGFMGSTPIVGGTVPLAVGYGWANRLRKKRPLAAAFFGDGCFEEGVIHESLNFAALKKAPVLFICENNGYSVCTSLEERQPNRPIHGIAAAHGWGAESGNGDDVLEVYRLTRTAVDKIRSGAGPQFLEFSTHRWYEHCGPNEDDQRSYRGIDELHEWKQKCPIEKLKRKLIKDGTLTSVRLAKIERLLTAEIQKSFREAVKSAPPSPTRMRSQVYAA